MKKQPWIIDKLHLDKAYEALLEYLELRLELAEVQIKERTVMILSSVALLMIIVSTGLFVMLFFSVALAMWLNSLLESIYAGYLIVGGLFLLLCIVIIAARRSIIISRFIKLFFEDSFEERKNEDASE